MSSHSETTLRICGANAGSVARHPGALPPSPGCRRRTRGAADTGPSPVSSNHWSLLTSSSSVGRLAVDTPAGRLAVTAQHQQPAPGVGQQFAERVDRGPHGASICANESAGNDFGYSGRANDRRPGRRRTAPVVGLSNRTAGASSPEMTRGPGSMVSSEHALRIVHQARCGALRGGCGASAWSSAGRCASAADGHRYSWRCPGARSRSRTKQLAFLLARWTVQTISVTVRAPTLLPTTTSTPSPRGHAALSSVADRRTPGTWQPAA